MGQIINLRKEVENLKECFHEDLLELSDETKKILENHVKRFLKEMLLS